MYTLIEFITFYHQHGKTPSQIGYPKSPLNKNQLHHLYQKYLKSEMKKKTAKQRHVDTQKKKITQQIENPKVDERWNKVKREVFKRDKYKCQLLPYLPDEYVELRNNLMGLDSCHIFGKGAYPHMKYDVDNIVTLHRLLHIRMDGHVHPFNGERISHEEILEWWKMIVGSKRFTILLERSKRR